MLYLDGPGLHLLLLLPNNRLCKVMLNGYSLHNGHGAFKQSAYYVYIVRVSAEPSSLYSEGPKQKSTDGLPDKGTPAGIISLLLI